MIDPDELPDPTKLDKAANERIAPYAFNMEEAISYFEDNFPAPAGHEIKFEEVTVSSQKDPLGNYHLPGVAKPETEIPPIREFPDGTMIRVDPEDLKRFKELGGLKSLPLHAFECQSWFPDVEYGFLPDDTEWLSLAKSEIPKAVKEYVKLIETGETTKWCKCPWAVHPDHVDIPADHCVACGQPKAWYQHTAEVIVSPEAGAIGVHHFKGRGVRRMDTDPMCPVHTREGLILGLFEHLFKEEDETPSDSSE